MSSSVELKPKELNAVVNHPANTLFKVPTPLNLFSHSHHDTYRTSPLHFIQSQAAFKRNPSKFTSATLPSILLHQSTNTYPKVTQSIRVYVHRKSQDLRSVAFHSLLAQLSSSKLWCYRAYGMKDNLRFSHFCRRFKCSYRPSC